MKQLSTIRAGRWAGRLALVGLALGMGQAAKAQPVSPTDPASVLLAFEKSAGVDVDAGLALVADDAVLKITPPPQGTSGLWSGKEEVRQALQYSKDHLVKREVVGTPQVNGNKVTDTVMVSNDVFQRLGVAPVQFSTEAVIEGGKIESFATIIAPSEQSRVAAAAQAQGAQGAPPPDPASVLVAWEKVAFGSSQDIDAALALMTDDAVLTVVPAPPPGTQTVWTGKAAIRQALQTNRTLNVTRENIGMPQVTGNKVTVTAMVSNSFLQMLGVAPVQATTEVVVEGGKIKSYTSSLLPAEQQRVAAAAQAYQAAHAGQQPGGMPKTGSGGLTAWWAAGLPLLIGLCLMMVGVGIRRTYPGRRKHDR